MKLIAPIAVTDTSLITTDVPETDYPVWIDATYVKGDYVISTATHTIYRCLVAHTLGSPVDPDVEAIAFADPLIEDPATQYWQTISATNLWKLFDSKPSVQCEQADDFTVTIKPLSAKLGVALFNVEATEVNVTITDVGGDGEIYNTTVQLVDNGLVIDWLTYFTEDIIQSTEYVYLDLPLMYTGAEVKITVTNTGSTAKCGQIVLGNVKEFGIAVVDATGFNGLDFSYVDVDEYGDLTRFVRAASRLATINLVVPSTALGIVSNLFNTFRGASPAVWIADPNSNKAGITYGFYRDYDVVYKAGDLSYMSIEIQGIV